MCHHGEGLISKAVVTESRMSLRGKLQLQQRTVARCISARCEAVSIAVLPALTVQ